MSTHDESHRDRCRIDWSRLIAEFASNDPDALADAPPHPPEVLHTTHHLNVGPWRYELDAYVCPATRYVLSHRLTLHRLH